MKKLLLSLIAMFCATSFAFADGKAGDNIDWYWSDMTQRLSFSGTGAMWDYEDPGFSSFYKDASDAVKIEIGEGITHIGNNAFYGYNDCKTLTLPSSLTSIGVESFAVMDALTTIQLPSKLKTIGEKAFYDCDGLTYVTFPASVTSIDPTAFSHCSKMMSYFVEEGNKNYISVNRVVYTADKTTLVLYPLMDAEDRFEYEIPYGTTTISEDAFYGVQKLATVHLPATIKELKAYSFATERIKNLYCPTHVPPTADNAFTGGMDATNSKIYIPTGATAAYKAAAGWSKFKNFIEMDFQDVVDPNCAVPSGLALVGEPSFSAAEVKWTPGSNSQAGWGLRYKKSSESEYHNYPNRIANTGASSYSIPLINLEPNTSYNVVVYGVCGDDVEDYIISNNSSVFTFTTADVPAEQTTPTIESDWVYYGTNTFGMDIEIVENPCWGIMIPNNMTLNKYLDQVKVYASSLDKLELDIYSGGTNPKNATKVWSQTVQPTDINAFNTFKLLDPVEYNKSKSLWIFLRHTQAFNNPMPASADANAPNARWIGIAAGDNINWMDVKDYDAQYTYFAWLIDAHFTATPEYVPYAINLQADRVTDNAAIIKWAGRGKFEARYGKEGTPVEDKKVVSNITAKTYTFTGLEKSAYYEFEVRAMLNDVWSDWSEVLKVLIEKPQAINSVEADKAQSQKVIRNGQLFILHDGKVFNAAGIRVE